jgi:thiamine biosynthesis lipoprotein
MGVPTRIVVYATDSDTATNGAAAAFEEIARLDALLSDYRADSELSRLGAASGGPAIRISPELFEVLAAADRLARDTNGAFDVTAGPLILLWREARKTRTLPDPDALEAARAKVGYEKVVLDPRGRTARLTTPGMRLDLGGIAKGYAARRTAGILRDRGLPRCLVALAGDIQAGDPPPDAMGWRILVPLRGDHSQVTIRNMAVSTSGDTEQFVEIGGVRYSHILDPRTGVGVTAGVAATVFALRGETADALATTICVLGTERGQALIAAHPGTAAVITRPGGGAPPVAADPGEMLPRTPMDPRIRNPR